MVGIEIVQPIGNSMPRWRERRWSTNDQPELAPKALSAMALSTGTPRTGVATVRPANRETCH
jgi:hypothetical protein